METGSRAATASARWIKIDVPVIGGTGRYANVRERQPLRDTYIFTEGISSLPPGKEINVLFDQGPTRTQLGLPDAFDVVVRCSDARGRRLRPETYRLDLGIHRGVSRIRRNDLHDLTKEVEKLTKAVRSLNR